SSRRSCAARSTTRPVTPAACAREAKSPAGSADQGARPLRGRRGRADVVADDGEHQGAAGDGVLDDAAVEGEDGADVLLGEHLGRGAAGVQAASGQGDEVVGVAGGEVEVVQDHHDGGAAVAVQVGQQVEDLDLVAGVEERG